VTAHGADVQCVILAGGLATRMRPLASTVPKALFEVNGEPFAYYQLRSMQAHDVTDVLYCIGHLGDQIRTVVGDGSRFGLRVRYSHDGPTLLGTAGALRLAAERGLLAESFLVTYCDSFLRIDFGEVLRAFRGSDAPAMMVVYRNEDRWDRSNVRVAHGRVDLYEKHGAYGVQGLTHIDYGLSALHRSVVEALPAGAIVDLADVYHRLSVEGKLAAYPAEHRFYEIGSPQGLADFAAWAAGPRVGPS
jgi:N-acetyl-alpha-D-muramate 1-phosphate uridylyltransferase